MWCIKPHCRTHMNTVTTLRRHTPWDGRGGACAAGDGPLRGEQQGLSGACHCILAPEVRVLRQHLTLGVWLQTGYNLLYGCWKYSWDADCELFLKILRGEVKEDVYVEQIQLQVQTPLHTACVYHGHGIALEFMKWHGLTLWFPRLGQMQI